ncbi:MAG TPA: hypothetical protein DCQ50_00755 [Chryseobacterium sp.]|nr:hypothetical protein [Chryseobacterium sp.]
MKILELQWEYSYFFIRMISTFRVNKNDCHHCIIFSKNGLLKILSRPNKANHNIYPIKHKRDMSYAKFSLTRIGLQNHFWIGPKKQILVSTCEKI